MENFKATYRQAYEHISPPSNFLEGIVERVEEKHRKRQQKLLVIMRPVAITYSVMLVLSLTILPVMAQNYPGVYKMLEGYAPALADFVLPIELSDTSQGITMQVEAVKVENNATENDNTGSSTAEIIVSFSDAEGSDRDLINGRVDMYDSYYLQSYGVTYNTGGGGFLEYDETEDKAYFRIQLSSDDAYEEGKLRFKVRRLLTNSSEEKQWIDLENIVKNPATKAVTLTGGGGGNRELFNQYFKKGNVEDPRPGANVMDILRADESKVGALTVTGVGYADGILRIQTGRGNLTDADRHMQPFLVDSQGNERHNDHSVGWQEEVNGEKLTFEEHWFLVEEDELENIRVYGIFYITDGCVNGNWEVTLPLERGADTK